MSCSKHEAHARVGQALAERRYFKLICGASFHDVEKIKALIHVYAQAGIDCVDVACEPPVLQAVLDAYEALPPESPQPLVMVSLDVDGDPHFRKIQVSRTACVNCEACLPACPVDALWMDETHEFQIHHARCYGCLRCLPTCPTQALSIKPTHTLPEALIEVLSHPRVGAVELHAHYLDVSSLQRLFDAVGPYLEQKWVSLCFRPNEHPPSTVEAYLTCFEALCHTIKPYGVMLQIDGKAMQADESAQSSLAALEGANALGERWKARFAVTISGGINAETARLLKEAPYQWIAGVGMGTLARQRIWHYMHAPPHWKHAQAVAFTLVDAFKRGSS